MSEFEIEISARSTAINRVLGFLLCQFARPFSDKAAALDTAKYQMLGEAYALRSGVMDADILCEISRKTELEIEEIFSKARSLCADSRS